jgi:predicted cupin superfamily sugar epimerase
MHARAQQLIHELGLQPHPEGGFYREIYRSAEWIQPLDGRDRRSALTTIYFLLPAGAHSRWHRVSSDEVWHLYEGGPLELLIADPSARAFQSISLSQASSDAGPVYAVPAGWWQAARPGGDYALVGCTVGPGFEFADFSFLRDAAAQAAELRALRPDWAALL